MSEQFLQVTRLEVRRVPGFFIGSGQNGEAGVPREFIADGGGEVSGGKQG